MIVKAPKKLNRYAGQEEKSTWRGGARTLRENLKRNRCFTAMSLRELLPGVLKSRLKMPTDAALQKLASTLEFHRGQYWRNQNAEQLEKKVAVSADNLLSALKELGENYADHGSESLKKKIGKIDQVTEAINQLFNESIAVEHYGNTTWRFLANVLPAYFAEAIQTTNPEYKIKISSVSAIVRFIHKIAPLLTGEHPTPGTITTELKEFKKKFLAGKQFGDRIAPPDLSKTWESSPFANNPEPTDPAGPFLSRDKEGAWQLTKIR
jgi:hypothetical protein